LGILIGCRFSSEEENLQVLCPVALAFFSAFLSLPSVAVLEFKAKSIDHVNGCFITFQTDTGSSKVHVSARQKGKK